MFEVEMLPRPVQRWDRGPEI